MTHYTHVFPVNDLREHDADEHSPDCWCKPRTEEGGRVIIHNAKDGREFAEAKKELH